MELLNRTIQRNIKALAINIKNSVKTMHFNMYEDVFINEILNLEDNLLIACFVKYSFDVIIDKFYDAVINYNYIRFLDEDKRKC